MNINELRREIEKIKLEIEKRDTSSADSQREPIENIIAPVYLSVHADIQENKHVYYNLPGGRGSGKSSFVSCEIVNGVMEDKSGKSNAIVFRRTAATMRESVFAQIAWAIDELGVSSYWKSSVNPMQFTYKPTGAQIIFRGLDDSSKLKSLKSRRGMFKYIWFEEFSELPGANFSRSVIQSVLRGGQDFVVFRSFNPPMSKSNWANQYIEQADEKSLTFRTNYTQIPAEWLGDSFIYEAERLKQVNERSYLHEYMGEAVGTGGDVFPNIEVREITQEEINDMGYIYCGLDWGFSVDPFACIKLSYDQRTDTLYFLDEIYEKGLSNSAAAKLLFDKGFTFTGRMKQGSYLDGYVHSEERQLIICDSAEPKSIADLQALGVKAIACKKYPGSVMYGIKWLQNRKIVIDPRRTPNAHREFVNYQYETTKDGEFLSEVPDKDNHLIDATRYGCEKLINNRRVSA